MAIWTREDWKTPVGPTAAEKARMDAAPKPPEPDTTWLPPAAAAALERALVQIGLPPACAPTLRAALAATLCHGLPAGESLLERATTLPPAWRPTLLAALRQLYILLRPPPEPSPAASPPPPATPPGPTFDSGRFPR